MRCVACVLTAIVALKPCLVDACTDTCLGGGNNGKCNDPSFAGSSQIKMLQPCTLEQATPMENRLTYDECRAHAESLGHRFSTIDATGDECFS